MIKRRNLLRKLKTIVDRCPVVFLIGPRQCGKTTLAHNLINITSSNYFNLEDPASLSRLNDPMEAFKSLEGLVVIDEIHTKPDLFPVLKILSDRRPLPARFLLISSVSPRLFGELSKTLAGKAEILFMTGFDVEEVGINEQNRHWLRGGFPSAYLSESDAASLKWRKNFLDTFINEYLSQIDPKISDQSFQKLWTSLADCHGRVLNTAELSRSLSLNETSILDYLNLFEDMLLIRRLHPLFPAQVKERTSPKVYFRDSGLLHHLLGLTSIEEILKHPQLETSWKGYIIEELLRIIEPDEAYFWSDGQAAEIDLVLFRDGTMYGVVCDRAEIPSIKPTMLTALSDLGMEKMTIIYPGDKRFPLHERIEAVPVSDIIHRII
jgi:uncharacterized protein